ncbi:MAG: hypothetical protein KDD50_13840, partial [Bdellovibrionales bacterium]|nr:hypothetical protein [Bdellovibrionales bacterium]
PDVIGFGIYKAINKKVKLGMGLSIIPSNLLLSNLISSETSQVSERYNMLVSPQANIINTGIKVKYSPWLKRSSLEFFYGLLIVNAGGKSSLQNSSSLQSAYVAEVDVTLIQSYLGCNYIYDFYKSENLKMGFQIGLSYRFNAHLKSRLRGSLPAFLDVAPEYRSSVVDGTAELIDHISSDLNENFNTKRILPSIGFKVTW